MKIFAHRGASADAPENTLMAFSEAISQGADGIELDIFQHGQELLVIHDSWLARTTNGSGNIQDHSLAQLQQLDAGAGQTIPTLKQVLELIDGRCELNIEIKGLSSLDCLVRHVDMAQRDHHFDLNQLLVSSFDHHRLKEIKTAYPHIRVGALTANKPLTYARFAQELDAYSVHADVTFLDLEFVQDAKRRNLKVFAYTVDYAADIKRLQQWGLDGIFTNRPEYALHILKSSSDS